MSVQLPRPHKVVLIGIARYSCTQIGVAMFLSQRTDSALNALVAAVAVDFFIKEYLHYPLAGLALNKSKDMADNCLLLHLLESPNQPLNAKVSGVLQLLDSHEIK